MPTSRLTPGERLRTRRLALGLTLREVHETSISLAEKHGKPEFILPASRLHEVEVKGIVPSIFRLYTLSWVYGATFASCCVGTESRSHNQPSAIAHWQHMGRVFRKSGSTFYLCESKSPVPTHYCVTCALATFRRKNEE